MAKLKTYRCWFKDGSANLVTQESHEAAAREAQELAQMQNADLKHDMRAFRNACKVTQTECLTDGTSQKWK